MESVAHEAGDGSGVDTAKNLSHRVFTEGSHLLKPVAGVTPCAPRLTGIRFCDLFSARKVKLVISSRG